MPKKMVAALCYLASATVWTLILGHYVLAGVQVAMLVGLWRASPSLRTLVIGLSVFSIVVFPLRLQCVATAYSISPTHVTPLHIILTAIGISGSVFLVWVLTHKDTKRWIASKHPDKIIAGLQD